MLNNILAHVNKTQSIQYLKLSEIGIFNKDSVRNTFCTYYRNGKQKARYCLNTETGILDIHQLYQNGQPRCTGKAKIVTMEQVMMNSEIHLRFLGLLKIFRPDGKLGVSADFGDVKSLNDTDVRWIDSLLPRIGQVLEVWGKENVVEYDVETFDLEI